VQQACSKIYFEGRAECSKELCGEQVGLTEAISPAVNVLRRTLVRDTATGDFRPDVDAPDRYATMAAMGYYLVLLAYLRPSSSAHRQMRQPQEA
jgi:hypothetical protein